ncbi:MAG: hypothetical protein ACYTGB_07040, partial [Planctomycetota bacterium]
MRRTEVKKVLPKSALFAQWRRAEARGPAAAPGRGGLEGGRIGRTIRFMTSDAAREIDRLR